MIMTDGKKSSKNILHRYNRTISGTLLLLAGCLFLLNGIHRGEYRTVEQKSNVVCLECIGIG